MKLQQLRYALEVYKQNLNVSDAANSLFTSQPGISKQIKLLEDELGVQIFIRQGKRIVNITEPGKLVLETAAKVLRETGNIKKISQEFANQSAGAIMIAGVYGYMRYILPDRLCVFKERYPEVKISLLPTNSVEVVHSVSSGEIDLGIINENMDYNQDLCYLPCASWSYQLLMPATHPLANKPEIELADLNRYPLITYDLEYVNQERITRAFNKAALPLPPIVLSSFDPDLIITYVRRGLGIGLIESQAIDLNTMDVNLEVVSVAHLFSEVETRILLRKDRYIKGYVYELINLLNPHLTKERVDKLMSEIRVDYEI